MIVSKGVSFLKIIQWSWIHITWLLLFSSGIATLYYFNILKITIPWLPISVIGTAVAFFVGFKNNQAYDRMWEARKIWGGLINNSRTWGMKIDGYITQTFNKNISLEEIKEILQSDGVHRILIDNFNNVLSSFNAFHKKPNFRTFHLPCSIGSKFKRLLKRWSLFTFFRIDENCITIFLKDKNFL